MKKTFTAKELENYYRKKYNKIPQEVIRRLIKKKGLTVYGARSYNAHFPQILDKHTDDFDTYGDTPKKTAKRIEKKLDKEMGGNYYYNTEAEYPNTHKVKSYITEKTVVDITKPEEKIPYKIINGIRYQKLSYAKKKAKETLKNPEACFRWMKEKEFLRRLKVYEKYHKPMDLDKFKLGKIKVNNKKGGKLKW